ncbi:MAG: hypothetical protein IKE63_06535 [Bacilli bacterium]|nr:hypothetical protein [Bacilli bacterium]
MRIDRDNVKIILLLLIVGLGLGYAYINSDLNINGTAQVKHANWDIHWANVQVTNGSVTGSNVVTQPTISNGTTVNYSVILPIPGDYYEFTVDAVNGGQMDAMIDTIDFKLNGATLTELPAYLKYSITYTNDEPLQANQQLLHNTTETYKVRIEYRDDIELNQIPATNQNLSLQFTVTYRQATAAATVVDHSIAVYTTNYYRYGVGDYTISVGSAIPASVTQFSTPEAAMANAGQAMNDSNPIPVYLKNKVLNGIVQDIYVEFVITPEIANITGKTAGTYSLKWIDTKDFDSPSTNYCKAEYYNSTNDVCTSPAYATYKTQMFNVFGSNKCYNLEGTPGEFICSFSPENGLSVNLTEYGTIIASYVDWNCGVTPAGEAYCGERTTYW